MNDQLTKLLNALTAIPSPHDKPIQLSASDLDLIAFLVTFNLVDQETFPFIRAKNEEAELIIKSMIQYLNHGTPMISQEEGLNIISYNKFLLNLEHQRFQLQGRSAQPLQSKRVIRILIKAEIKGSNETVYLTQYSNKKLIYQLIGGYATPDLELIPNVIDLLNEEVPEMSDSWSRLSSENIKFIETELEATGVSVRSGVVTRYLIQYAHVKVDSVLFKLNKDKYWASLTELHSGVTARGSGIRSPFDNIDDHTNILKLFDELPLSIEEQQQPTPEVNDYSEEETLLYLLNSQEESDKLELKSSLRWDWRAHQVNKELEKAVLKNLAAFLNSDGGQVIIGVDDQKKIVGIAADMQTLNKKNLDGYMQVLVQLISDNLGLSTMKHINIKFITTSAGIVCSVLVSKSAIPVFLKEKDRREFYVRVGNITRNLDAGDLYEYIQINW